MFRKNVVGGVFVFLAISVVSLMLATMSFASEPGPVEPGQQATFARTPDISLLPIPKIDMEDACIGTARQGAYVFLSPELKPASDSSYDKFSVEMEIIVLGRQLGTEWYGFILVEEVGGYPTLLWIQSADMQSKPECLKTLPLVN
jgi:hypothetical protein